VQRLLIDTPELLLEHTERWRACPWLALDTEFMREETYYPQLCLVQVSDGRDAHCVDALALKGEPVLAFMNSLAAPTITKVFHAASQDLEIFVQLAGDCPRPLFDTQQAAAMLGDGDQLGYAGLVEKRLGVTLDKSLTRANWARRPLSDAELAYAADDVRWLAQLYPMLLEELQARDRLRWLLEDSARLGEAERYRIQPADAWKRLKGIVRLAPAAQGAAMALADWRERMAQSGNRPRKWIVDDDVIYRLAERRPQSMAQLENLGLLAPKTLARHGEALLELLTGPPVGAPMTADAPLTDVQKAVLKKLQEALLALAGSLGIPPSLLAPRADIEAVVRSGRAANVPLLRGWRAEVAEEVLAGLPE